MFLGGMSLLLKEVKQTPMFIKVNLSKQSESHQRMDMYTHTHNNNNNNNNKNTKMQKNLGKGILQEQQLKRE